MKLKSLLLLSALISSAFAAHAAPAPAPATQSISQAFAYPLANVPGKKMTALVVDYAPGGTTAAHRHGEAFVVAYVLEGEITSQVDDGKVKTYHAGESWTEQPGAHHRISKNASKTKPAKLLAIFITDDNQKNLVQMDK